MWLSTSNNLHRSRSAPRKAASLHPALEALEDRTVPALLAPAFIPNVGFAQAVGDFNNDGRGDIVTRDLKVLLGNADGSFRTVQSSPAPDGDVAVADLNRDGKLDVVHGELGSLLGKGDGTFGPARALKASSSPVLADLNRDGIVDLVATGIQAKEITRQHGTTCQF